MLNMDAQTMTLALGLLSLMSGMAFLCVVLECAHLFRRRRRDRERTRLLVADLERRMAALESAMAGAVPTTGTPGDHAASPDARIHQALADRAMHDASLEVCKELVHRTPLASCKETAGGCACHGKDAN